MRFLQHASLVVLAVSPVLLGQEVKVPQTKKPLPLYVESTSEKIDSGSSHKVTLLLRHVGESPIRAYVVRVDLADSSGNATSTACTMSMAGLTPKSKSSWQPGETMHEEVNVAADAQWGVQRYKASVDYVVQSDGSSVGPDTCHQSLKIAGIELGFRVARANLKKILMEQGVGALSEELNK